MGTNKENNDILGRSEQENFLCPNTRQALSKCGNPDLQGVF